jgi:hypothetical protein
VRFSTLISEEGAAPVEEMVSGFPMSQVADEFHGEIKKASSIEVL